MFTGTGFGFVTGCITGVGFTGTVTSFGPFPPDGLGIGTDPPCTTLFGFSWINRNPASK